MNTQRVTWPEFKIKASLIPVFAMILSFGSLSLVHGESTHCGKGQIRLFGTGTCNTMDSMPLQEIDYSKTLMKVAFQDFTTPAQSPLLNPNFI